MLSNRVSRIAKMPVPAGTYVDFQSPRLKARALVRSDENLSLLLFPMFVVNRASSTVKYWQLDDRPIASSKDYVDLEEVEEILGEWAEIAILGIK